MQSKYYYATIMPGPPFLWDGEGKGCRGNRESHKGIVILNAKFIGFTQGADDRWLEQVSKQKGELACWALLWTGVEVGVCYRTAVTNT